MSEQLFTARLWISTEVVYLQRWHGWCHMKLLPSRRVLCTPYNHAPCHFMQSHIRKVYACLAVTCHLHFWQNDRDLLRATAVTRGWNGYRNQCQHRKLTLEKKILPPLLQGFEPATFRSRVQRSNPWAIPVPNYVCSRGSWCCLYGQLNRFTRDQVCGYFGTLHSMSFSYSLPSGHCGAPRRSTTKKDAGQRSIRTPVEAVFWNCIVCNISCLI